jgi:hypothetical protein
VIWMILVTVLAFIAGLGLTTGIVVMRAPAHVAKAVAMAGASHDSTAVDSSASVAKADSAKAPLAVAAPAAPAAPVANPTTVAPVQAVAAAPAASSSAAPRVTSSAALTAAPAVHTPEVTAALRAVHDSSSGGVLNYKAVAKLLMNMKPTDAGHVLGYLNDDQVEGILRALGARQAAVLVTQMPASRAAALSRRLLQPAPSGAGS